MFQIVTLRPGIEAVLAVNECSCLAEQIGGLREVAAGLADRSQALQSVRHLGVAFEEFLTGRLGLVEPVLLDLDEIDHAVGQLVEVVFLQYRTHPTGSVHSGAGGGVSGMGTTLGVELACPSLCLGRQHFLYMMPLPQGQGALRLILAMLILQEVKYDRSPGPTEAQRPMATVLRKRALARRVCLL